MFRNESVLSRLGELQQQNISSKESQFFRRDSLSYL